MAMEAATGSFRKAQQALRHPPCWKCSPTLLEDFDPMAEYARKPDEEALVAPVPSTPSGRITLIDEQYFKKKRPFKPWCAFSLVVVGEGKDWYLTWKPDRASKDKFRSELFSRMDGFGTGDGMISWEEFDKWCEDEKNKEEIANSPTIYHGLLHQDVRQVSFEAFDADQSKSLSRDEFERFLLTLEREFYKYLLRSALLSFRAYWGRGLPPPELPKEAEEQEQARPFALLNCFCGGKALRKASGEKRLSDQLELLRALVIKDAKGQIDGLEFSQLKEMQDSKDRAETASAEGAPPARLLFLGRDDDGPLTCGLFPPGWVEDFKYYSANCHPLMGIFACDKFHPLDWKERLMMELSTLCSTWFSLWFAGHYHDMFDSVRGGAENKFLFTLVFATLPGMIWWYVLFYLFTMPCTNVNEAQASVEEQRKMTRIRQVGEAVGHTLVFLGFLLPLCGGMMDDKIQPSSTDEVLDAVAETIPIAHAKVILGVLSGRMKAYIIAWVLQFSLAFNPFVAIGNPNPLAQPTMMSKIADSLAIGQWRMEKMRLKSLCLYGLGMMDA